MLELLLIASLTCVATGLGVIPVLLLGERAAAIRPALLGVAAGVMTVAAIAGLLLPALDEGTASEVGLGALAGVGFLAAARSWIEHRGVGGPELAGATRRTAILVFAVLLVHSLPEGFAIGTAYASETAGLGLFVVVAIAIQNIPEGTSVAIPMQASGDSTARQFWAATATSIPQPIGAAIAFVLVEEITSLLPVSFGFAAGAMLALVAVELVPQGWRDDRRLTGVGTFVGAAAMLGFSSLLGV
ncbi:MAG TPA: ZIP family metal transporter [Solirubrobacterales bacterium]